ncbi:hypothetical protein ONZ45_g14406 [Pleurotus djamor]|nr:hypothetical protein ONZ45_g14406 [Pleurotus djamor]
MDPAVLQQIAQNTSNLPVLFPEIQKLFEKLDNRLEHLSKGLEHFTASVDRRLQRIQNREKVVDLFEYFIEKGNHMEVGVMGVFKAERASQT